MAHQIWRYITDTTGKKKPCINPAHLQEVTLWDVFEASVELETIGIGIMQLNE